MKRGGEGPESPERWRNRRRVCVLRERGRGDNEEGRRRVFFYIRGFRRTRVRRYSVGIIKIYQMPIRENFQAVWFSRANLNSDGMCPSVYSDGHIPSVYSDGNPTT